MARSYRGLVNMATRFGFRLVKAREDHSTSACQCDTCLRTRTACCHSAALRTWSGSLARWRKSEPSAERRFFKRTIPRVPNLVPITFNPELNRYLPGTNLSQSERLRHFAPRRRFTTIVRRACVNPLRLPFEPRKGSRRGQCRNSGKTFA